MSSRSKDDRASGDSPARSKLIEAAGQLFAQKGYRAVTIRDICKAAGLNSAAANYHFGGKKALFQAVLTYAFAQAGQRRSARGDARQQLRDFIEQTLRHILLRQTPDWHQPLMLRIMQEDADLFQETMHEVIRSEFELLLAILKQLKPQVRDKKTLQKLGYSILAQCLFFHHNRTLVQIIDPGLLSDKQSVKRLTDHILAFSLAGLETV